MLWATRYYFPNDLENETFIYNFYSIAFFSLMGCDDDDSPPQGKGQLTIEFDNRVGEEDLELNKDYANTNGETFRCLS